MSGPDRRTEADHLREFANRKQPPAREGWGVLRAGERRYHYYRDGRSLCSRVGFYRGTLEADDGQPSSNDCKGCRKILSREEGSSK